MKRKSIMLLVSALIACSLSLSGCGKNTAAPSKDTAAEESAKITTDVKESSEKVELTADELDEFTDLFDTYEYNGFLVTPYSSASEISWDDVLYNGAGISKEEISKSEENAYLAAVNETELYTDLTAIDSTSLNEYMESHAGVSLDDVKDSFDWTYIEKTDSYYFQHGDTNYEPFTCVSGYRLDDTYVATFESDWSEDDYYASHPARELTFQKTDDGYLIVSNIYLWEEGNDPDQTFDIDLSWVDGTCRFVTYQGSTINGTTARMVITCDSKQVDWLTSSIYPTYEDESLDIITINAVGVFDFNADGLTDIVIVADCSDGLQHMVLYEAQPGSYFDNGCYLAMLSDTSLWLEGFVSGELNIPNIKAYLLGDNTSGYYDNWKDAYGQLIKIDNVEYNSMFSLAYIDNDEIPELVVDDVGYRLKIYTYKDGHAYRMGDQLAYGTSGNSGYEYARKKNCITYSSTEYAGIVFYTNYMSIKDNQIINDYTVKINNYDDLNGNGQPDDDEMTDKALNNATGETVYESEDGKLSAAEIQSRVEEIQNNYSFEPLAGEYEYVEFLDYLAAF